MLILASTSLYRKQLLEKLNIPFICIPPQVSEAPHANEPPNELAMRLSVEKALAVENKHPGSLIIGSDQVAYLSGTGILSKPGNFEAAKKQLLACSGKSVVFYTGLCLVDTRNRSQEVILDTFEVRFRTLTEAVIEKYLKIDEPFQCAGSFKVEAMGIRLFESLSGGDPNSLMGLPLISLCDLLLRVGVDPLDYPPPQNY